MSNPTVIIKKHTTKTKSNFKLNDGIDPGDTGGGVVSPTNKVADKYSTLDLLEENKTYNVKIMRIRLTQNMDGIFGGGSEINVIRIGAEPDFEGYVIEDRMEFERTISRTEVADRIWIYLNSSFDPNWSTNQLTQGFTVYDYDWYASISNLTFSPSVKYGGVTITGSFTAEMESDDSYIYYQTSYNRTVFMNELVTQEWLDPYG